MVGFQPPDSSNDSDVIGSEDEFECYRAAFNNTAPLYCMNSVDGKDVLVSLEHKKPEDSLIVDLGAKVDKCTEKKPQECWDVDYADTIGRGDISRYYNPVQMTCYNCNENGHVKYDCPKPRKAQPCLACGMVGHTYRNCSHALCYNCGYPGHTKKDCSMPIVPSWKVCMRCQIPGHNESHCPDKWRQFHATTSHGPPVQPSSPPHRRHDNRPVYCYNCGRQGHWGYECPEEAPDDAYYAGPQLVIRYDTTASSLAQMKKRKVKKEADQPGYSDTVVSDSSAKSAAKKHRNKSHFPRSKSLASDFPVKKTEKKVNRRCRSLDEGLFSKEANLGKVKSRSHKSLEKLDKIESKVEKPKKFNKIKEELEKLGVNRGKKKNKSKNSNGNTNHVSFKEDKKSKKVEEDNYGYNRNKPMPNQNHAHSFIPERTKNKKSNKGQDGKNQTVQGAQQGKKGKKKNKKGNGFNKSTNVFS